MEHMSDPIYEKEFPTAKKIKSGKNHQDFGFLDDKEMKMAKDHFLAHLSHEIKTPLTAIAGFVNLALNNCVDEQGKNYLKIIERNSENLLLLLNNLLDFSKLESNQLEVEYSQFSLFDEIENTISSVRPTSEAKGLELEVDYVSFLPRYVRSDAPKIKQILINMLDNAIKFTEKGKVRLEIKVEMDAKTGDGYLRARVQDSGKGISDEVIEKLFTAFNGIAERRGLRAEGLGIGLILSKSLANQLGGDVHLLESREGEGTTFEVKIFLGSLEAVPFFNPTVFQDKKKEVQSTESNNRVIHSKPLNNLNILVAEDATDIQTLISHMITQLGGVVTICGDGLAALKEVQIRDFDLVLMDLQMPVMDGYESFKKMRSAGYDGRVVAFTAHALKNEREYCRDIGFDDFLPKPFDQSQLLDVVFRLTRSQPKPSIGPMDSDMAMDPDLKEAFKIYHENTQKLIKELTEFSDNLALQIIKQIAHKLKGSSGCYGYERVAHIASELCLLCEEEGADRETIQKLIDSLKREYEHVYAAYTRGQ